ncbi:hypothetical protein FKW77_007761 [Venturia effusa]|uniref:U6 small nuclear RNA (adenine-(43)-N(6))-methyltransferase n=1 Tax=Venturia effusa TaxID=50376 RepID=A0A517L9L9_9PEZI|nr:hypothetical protein FKW77_007761 [Venturia effusa]
MASKRRMPRPGTIKVFKPPTYNQMIDFEELALKDKDFSELLDASDGIFSFRKPEHVLQLAKSLLKRDFGLTMKLPNDRLCPAIPIRWSYVRWVQGLIDSTSVTYRDGHDPFRPVLGIDVGVGSSCIYPLLACSARSSWKFIGTDIDDTNYNHAVYNVTSNSLDRRIKLVKTHPNEPFWSRGSLDFEKADFTMCNPPFFGSIEELKSTFDHKAPPAVCTGADVEMVTRGGEVAYVSSMVEESKVLGLRIQWYTSQLGKAASLPIIVRKLKTLGCVNWAVGVLNPNERTRRWVIGWSWADLKPSDDIARNDEISVRQMPATEDTIAMSEHTKEDLANSINSILNSLPLAWSNDPGNFTGIAIMKGDVWSRAARRKMKRQGVGTTEPSVNSTEMTLASPIQNTNASVSEMVVRVSIAKDSVKLRWLKGIDNVLWESFRGMMRRKLQRDSQAGKPGQSIG